jgi:PTS system fructose-specific IIC component
MAAVMAGGMVPPLGIGLATLVFKKKFNDDQREAGKAALVLGASFITEGAIPFAAADPARVMPSIMVGGAVAGALSMALGATLAVPHGGIFVLFAVENILQYVFAILVGSVITAGLLGVLKKDVE